MSKEWFITSPWPDQERVARDWQLPELVVQILRNRHIETREQARAFLSPKLTLLHEPAELPGATAAAEIIVKAVRDGQRIVIYGDYDVDGIAGSAILWHLLTLAEAQVDVYIPHRIEEGYGLNSEALKTIKQGGADLAVTVDCGISSPQAAETARDLGLQLIVTDHHVAHEQLPSCAQIVHPTALGPSPNPDLCGAAVAFKLAWAVAQQLSPGTRVSAAFREFLLNATGLAALGTIADVVSLRGENRIIARHGLAGLPQATIVGLHALIESAGLSGSAIDSYAVGFKLAPRLNAAGRMGHARLALELLTRGADPDRAREIAVYLEEQNKARQNLERKIFRQAKDMVRHYEMDRENCRAIVLAEEDWHAGVIGIVASRLVDEFHRPTVMISLSDGAGQGSARSIRHFALDEALNQCSDLLLTHGGHRMAAGLRIAQERVDDFRRVFTEYANNRLTAKDLVSRLNIDAVVSLSRLDDFTVRMLLDLGPFGVGNPKPHLATDWVDLEGEPRCVGSSEAHLQFAVREGRVVRRAIGFGLAKCFQQLRDHRRCRIAFEPIMNSWRGRETVELQVTDMQFP